MRPIFFAHREECESPMDKIWKDQSSVLRGNIDLKFLDLDLDFKDPKT